MNLLITITILLIPILAILAIYILSSIISPRARKSKDRDMPYACGEDFPPLRPQITINLFWFATVFLVFDIIDFLIALAYNIELTSPFLPLTYLLLIVLALTIAIGWR